VKAEDASKARPVGLNTVSLLKVCSSAFGIGPQYAMHIAEKLYLDGFISYPRTESTHYPQAFNFTEIVSNLRSFFI
jgi:DNA topoisomerase-3